jgi:fatty acid desaturase
MQSADVARDPQASTVVSRWPALTPSALRPLLVRTNGRTAWIVFCTFAGILTVLAAAVVWPHPLVWAAVFLLVGGLQHHLSIIQHESVHHLLFTNRLLNEFFGALSGALTGFTMSYRKTHLNHHNTLGGDDDPDLKNYVDYPAGRRHLLLDAALSLSGLAAVVQFLQQGKTDSKGKKTFDMRLLYVVAAQAALLYCFWAAGAWYLYLLLWLAPLVTLTKSLAHFRNVVEHTQLRDVGHPELSRLRTIRCGPIEQFFFAPLYFNYHAEHHLHPGIPYYHLPEAHELLRNDANYRELVDVQKGYLRFLLRHAAHGR